MGTNYYLHTNVCKCCGRSDERLHIGKSSAGWVFSLRCHEDLGLMSLADWKDHIVFEVEGGALIKDEYGNNIDVAELYDTIEHRAWKPSENRTKAFLEANHAINGPNGLLRHDCKRLNGRGCGKYWPGEGTWDCMTGEFS